MENIGTTEADDEAWLYGGGGSGDGEVDSDLNNGNSQSQEDGVEVVNQPNGNGDDEDDADIYNITNKVSTLHTTEETKEDGDVDAEYVDNGQVGGEGEEEKHQLEDGQVANDDDGGGGGGGDEENEDEDEDDEDDKINVVIDLKKPFNGTMSPTRQTSKTSQVIINNLTAQKAGTTTGPVKGVDIDAQGQINGQPTMDYDLQFLNDEEKPWRKPGADITDYFNYGFNEDTWIAYSAKQKRLRSDNMMLTSMGISLGGGMVNAVNVIQKPQMTQPPPHYMHQQSPTQQHNGQSLQYRMPLQQQQQQRPQLQQPIRKIGGGGSGIIDVIETRRQYDEQPISTIGVTPNEPPPNWIRMTHSGPRLGPPPATSTFQHPFHSQPYGGGASYNVPPIQPPYGIPPPFMRQPPQQQQQQQQQQQWEKPQSDQYGGQYGGNEQLSPKSHADSPTTLTTPSSPPNKDQNKHTSTTSHHYGSSSHRRSPPSSPSRRYRSSHHYDRGDRHGRRGGDRSRSRNRSRSRSRSRSRDEKYKRSRRKSDSDDDHGRSTSKSHKRSKKSRRNRSRSRSKTNNENNELSSNAKDSTPTKND